MVLEILGDPFILALLAIMVVFIFLAYKIVKMLAKAAIIGLLAALFPVFANYFLGTEIPITLYNIIWFAVTGIGLFLVYSVVRGGWKVVRLILSPFKAIFRGKKKKD
ncbi:MAG: hypothetical protein JW754_01125 [Candidatus Aenigmarchaeota archaeon]|nr:hypothetical protein [Candidatus Aenigmarchaeota archaeon]